MTDNPLIEEYIKQKDKETKELLLKLGGVLYLQYEALIESGFSEHQALSMVDSLFVELCTRNFK